MIYIGLPQWSHPKWVRLGITSLEEYARHFNCVEGNTTLYALPKPEVVLRWREQTTDDFRFCFKFPATISHQAALRHCDDLVTEFLTRMSPLAPRIGQYWLQLPATFGPRELPALWHFLDSLPGEFNYGVEVRHPQFFAKGEEEQTLNRGLLLGPDAVVGLSARADEMLEYVKTADMSLVDYLGVGPLHETPTKTDCGLAADGTIITKSLEDLVALHQASPVPIVVGGGVKVADIPAVAQTGVDGFFVVSAVCAEIGRAHV